LRDALARWVKSPVLGTGLSETQQAPFGYRDYHNEFLVVLAGGGLFGIFALFVFIWQLYRLQPILILPFILPGITNGFLHNVPAVTIYGILIGHMLGRHWLTSNESEELPETDEIEEPAFSTVKIGSYRSSGKELPS
jgi:hypothetical protein